MENEAGQKRCAKLSPLAADQLFFPGVGGKVNKARAFCSECPVRGACLIDAIENDLDGFYAGTTKDERREMAKFRAMVIAELTEVIDSVLPKNLGRRRVFRKVVVTEDPYAFLDEIEPTIEELIILEA